MIYCNFSQYTYVLSIIGVDLQTGLWNTLLSVYIENQKDFEPIEFLKNLWETSSAEPNKVRWRSVHLIILDNHFIIALLPVEFIELKCRNEATQSEQFPNIGQQYYSPRIVCVLLSFNLHIILLHSDNLFFVDTSLCCEGRSSWSNVSSFVCFCCCTQ